MQPFARVEQPLTPTHDRTRSPQDRVSPYHAMQKLDRVLRRAPAPPRPATMEGALYRRLLQLERRETWAAFCNLVARCASALVIEGD
jgi:hypothetical protein